MTQTNKPTENIEAAKAFLASPSKLSSGKKNLRFQGSIQSNSLGQAQTNQSDGYPHIGTNHV